MVVQHSYKSYFYYFTYSSTEGVDINVANVLYHNHAEPIEGVVVDLQIEQQVDYTEQNIHFAYNLTVTVNSLDHSLSMVVYICYKTLSHIQLETYVMTCISINSALLHLVQLLYFLHILLLSVQLSEV